jgi:dipeptidyl aminopeptidase/acylaminoacyl peptidase
MATASPPAISWIDDMTDLADAWARLPSFTSIRASGDGKWAFFTLGGEGEVDELYSVPTDASQPAKRLTMSEDHLSIRDVSPDGARVILAQSVHSNEHDHLLLLDHPSGTLTQLTPIQSQHFLYGGSFTKDGTSIIFTADFDYGANEVTPGGWIWQQDLVTGARHCLAKSSTPFETGPKLSPDGSQILWHRHETGAGATQLWVMQADGSGAREILRLSDKVNSHGDWIDDTRIAFVSDHEGRDRLGVLDLSGGLEWQAGEPELLAHDVLPGRDGGFACIAHDRSRSIAVLFPGQSPLVNRSGRRSLLPHEALPGGGWLAEAYDADAPHQLLAIATDGRCTLLFTPPRALERQHIAPQDFHWTAQDGTPLQGWLYRPIGPSLGFIAYIHGGPTWHSEDWVNPKIAHWVQSGFTVLDPNYRGSTGFGQALREAVKEDGWGGREQSDIRAGIEACVEQGIATKGKIGITGNSYGGFSSWFGITRYANLIDAAIPMCGMYRLDIDYLATQMPHGRAYSEEMMGGTPDELPEKYDNASPGRFIDQIRGALMIVHGLADSNVGPENTHAAIRELTAAGIPHTALLYDNEGHGIFRRTNLADYLRRSTAFFMSAFAGAA